RYPPEGAGENSPARGRDFSTSRLTGKSAFRGLARAGDDGARTPAGAGATRAPSLSSPVVTGEDVFVVMRGLDPRIHAAAPYVRLFRMARRVKPGVTKKK
ncbi:MAG: hypothetical protein WB820_23190, partial [Rhodoplanes sp.]